MATTAAPLVFLARRLEELLKAVPGASDALLESSAPLLDPRRTRWPAWLALRDLGFRWILHSHSSRESFFGRRTIVREMLEAEVTLELRPGPMEALDAASPAAVARLVFPSIVVRQYSSQQLREWAPIGAQDEPSRTLLLRLGPEETLGIWSPFDGDQHEVDTDDVRACWSRPGSRLELDGDGPWPLELVLALVARLASPEAAAAPGESTPFERLDSGREVWDLARVGVETARSLQGWLDGDGTERPAPTGDYRDLLRSRWHVADGSLRVEPLVGSDGHLARPDEAQTFLAPFRLEWNPAAVPPTLSVVLELPDVVAGGRLRARLLEAFAEMPEDTVDDIVEAITDQVGAGLTPADVRAWCDPERGRATVMHLDRGRKDEHYLLVLTGIAGGRPVAALLDAEHTTLGIDGEGHRTVSRLDGLSPGYAGVTSGGLTSGNGAEGVRKLLSTLLRWRLLLP
jgi:hypothetical protein